MISRSTLSSTSPAAALNYQAHWFLSSFLCCRCCCCIVSFATLCSLSHQRLASPSTLHFTTLHLQQCVCVSFLLLLLVARARAYQLIGSACEREKKEKFFTISKGRISLLPRDVSLTVRFGGEQQTFYLVVVVICLLQSSNCDNQNKLVDGQLRGRWKAMRARARC